MRYEFRHLLLIFLFLFAQVGALAHGISHLHDQALDDEPVCEQCQAYAPIGAAAASTPLAWSAPAEAIAFEATIPAVLIPRFQSGYQSRAPPLTC